MPIRSDEISAGARGGTELMKQALEQGLLAAGRRDLLSAVDIYPSRVRDFDASRPSVYWMHDLPTDAEARHLKEDGGARFSAIAFVSDWQHQAFVHDLGLSHPRTAVIRNAIKAFEPHDWEGKWAEPGLGRESRPIRLIYHTTPHRGLALLVPGFVRLHERLAREDLHVTLDVYSSFELYGRPQADARYQRLFDACREHPAIRYHGAVANGEVRRALEAAHVFAYPSIWPETSCLALIEAMAAGCLCVHTNLGALPETSGGYTLSTPYVSDPELVLTSFMPRLERAVRQIQAASGAAPTLVVEAAARATRLYSWEARMPQWIELLETVKRRHASHVSG